MKDAGIEPSAEEQLLKTETKQDYIIESEEELTNLDEVKPQIKFKSKPQVKQISELKKKIIDEESSEEISTQDLNELVSQTILSFHEKYSLLNGGFVQRERLFDYINEVIETVSEDLIYETISKLSELKMILDIIELEKHTFYTFKEMKFEQLEKEFIAYALNKEPMGKAEFIEGLNWDEEEVLSVMKSLQSKGILRIEKDTIIIPGIVQKNKTS